MFGSLFRKAREIEREKSNDVKVPEEADVEAADRSPLTIDDHRDHLEDERLKRVLRVG